MGMAASQAHLLTITARLADNELRSQTINNAKMRLASQSAQASDTYMNALNDANLMFSNYDSSGMAQAQLLTYNSLTQYSSYNNQYGLVNSSGQLLVSESEAAMFDAANGNLNAYLKAHGLEYTTSYFDELGNLENPDYPIPFKNIEASTLKGWYEAYGSYENSLEVDNYEKYYAEYKDAASELNKACKPVVQEYLKSSSNSPKLNVDSSTGKLQLDGMPGNLQGMVNYLKNAFNSGTNTYGLEFLKNNNFLTDVAYNKLKKELEAFEIVSYVDNTPLGQISKSGVKVSYGASVSKQDLTYTIDNNVKITVDSNGVVTNVEIPPRETGDVEYKFEQTDITGNITTYNPVGQSIEEALKHLVAQNYTENEDGSETATGKSYYEATKDADGNIVVDCYAMFKQGDEANLLDEINSTIESMYDYILSSENFNYENFAMALAGNEQSVAGKVTVPAELQTVLDNYNTKKEQFLEFIFGEDDPKNNNDSFDVINKLIRESKISAKDLQDPDFVLKLVNGSVKGADGNPLVAAGDVTLSESYNTVVKQFVIENMIANTGEPKYAWKDENDKTNKGNADAKAQWYTNLFNRMKEGYKTIENGLAASSEWIEFALESGLVHMEQVDKSFNWKSLDYKTCSSITEETSSADAVAKAEAEYNRAMKDIDAKDSMYDMQLKNIDTEHTSLQTEYETIKGIINKNVDRTFKFNQNG